MTDTAGGSPLRAATEPELIGLALTLGARSVGSWSHSETILARRAARVSSQRARSAQESIAAGGDPLGDTFTTLRSAKTRRSLGATYTPPELVAAMLAWAHGRSPERIVDPGTGSGRFLVAAGRLFPTAELVGVELDPLAALTARAHLACAHLADRSQVHVGSYLHVDLPPCSGPTLFVGNPPYVRHHDVSAADKRWLEHAGRELGIELSGLSGAYVHFVVRTALLARPGDAGVFVTAAEWLKTNYGRALLRVWTERLGIERLHVVDARALPFTGAMTTAAVACFEVGRSARTIHVRRETDLGTLELTGGRRVAPERAPQTLGGPARSAPRRGWVPLGELCHVHRGQVTGNNHVWIAGADCSLPESVLYAAVTRAHELFGAGLALVRADALRRVIDLPSDLDELDAGARRSVDRFLARARSAGAHRAYIAVHRRPWWRVGLREPAPILATYMARRPPAFVRNLAGARHINIAHGLYPRVELSPGALDALARHLARSTSLAHGRAYAGGLVKFEPREMERLWVPSPETLERTGSRK